MAPQSGTTPPRLHKADLHLLSVFMTVTECGGFAAAQVAPERQPVDHQPADSPIWKSASACVFVNAGAPAFA